MAAPHNHITNPSDDTRATTIVDDPRRTNREDSVMEQDEAGENTQQAGRMEDAPSGPLGDAIDLSNNADDEADAQKDENKKKEKKKKSRSKKKKKNPVTGFEEFYADSPLTPAEALYERDNAYSKDRPFIDRIEECIQRYRARRKLDEEQIYLFDKYMFLGGVDSEQRQFTGIAEDIDALSRLEDKDELRMATARDVVGGAGSRFYEVGSKNWVVDFEGITKGFLSRMMTDLYQHDELANAKAAMLIRNFLNYILMHEVCPEYKDNILAARHICDVAPLELRAVHQLANSLPGPFHEAIKILLPGNGVVGCTETGLNDDVVAQNAETLSLVKVGLETTPGFQHIAAVIGTSLPAKLDIIEEKEQDYKITMIWRAGRDDQEAFFTKLEKFHISTTKDDNDDQPNKDGKEERQPVTATASTNISPLGVVTLRPTTVQSGYDNVPQVDEAVEDEKENEHRYNPQDIDLVLEDDILGLCEVGMKLRLVLIELALPPISPHSPLETYRLPISLHIIKSCTQVLPSFDTFLPQMLMTRWKDPVENTRPAPSVRNPYAEKGADEAHNGDGAGTVI